MESFINEALKKGELENALPFVVFLSMNCKILLLRKGVVTAV